jgi:tRNA(Ile)-lysidine synthase TilS/MesJ
MLGSEIMNNLEEIEKSLIKKFRKELWSEFTRSIRDYKLIEENDKIAVCVSGGKDSFLMAKLIQELIKHGKVKFEAIYMLMDPGYNKENMDLILKNAELLDVPLTIFKTDIFDAVASLEEGNPCYLCARMRRGHLYNKAKELGCNKIALAHHFDDVIETILLNMFYGGEYKTMLPKLHSKNFEGIDLIRPMYYIKESSVLAWMKYNDLKFINCACRFTEMCSIEENASNSKRLEMKKILSELRKINPNVDHNIFKSSDNVNINAILGYKDENKKHSFLDEF